MGLFPLNGKSITFEIHKGPSNLFIMVLMDSLASALKNINNAEKRGKRQVLLRPCSKVVVRFLKVMMKHGYIGEFEVVDDHRGGKIVVNLTGRLNKVGIISPRFDIGVKEVEKWTNNLLPSRQFGYIVMTTSGGIMITKKLGENIWEARFLDFSSKLRHCVLCDE